MTPIDHPQFIERLVQLADALGGRAPTQAGLAIWIQTLKEFQFHEISDQLDAWAKRSTKMPAPADVWKACNEYRTDRLEQAAKVEKVRERKEADAAFKRSDRLGKALRALVVKLRDQEPRDPKEWAETLWQRFISDSLNPPRNHPDDEPRMGTQMSYVQIVFAAAALKRTVEQAHRERDEYRKARAA